jgi:DNA-binding HxlR family transcriptional regulator
MSKEKVLKENCPVRRNIRVIGGKWSLLIIFYLKDGPKRFGELKRLIPDISEKMLIQSLKILAENKFISRKNFKTIPPKVEYSLLKKGKQALKIIDVISEM